jgi:hypothetical protein
LTFAETLSNPSWCSSCAASILGLCQEDPLISMVRDILELFDHDYQLISMAKKPLLLLPIDRAYLLLLLPMDRHYH